MRSSPSSALTLQGMSFRFIGDDRGTFFFLKIRDTVWKGVSLSEEALDEFGAGTNGEADYLVFLWDQEATCLLIICT